MDINSIAFFIFNLALEAHASIGLNENIYTGCCVNSVGIMSGCQARQEQIENIISFPTRADIKLHSVFNYSYTCKRINASFQPVMLAFDFIKLFVYFYNADCITFF